MNLAAAKHQALISLQEFVGMEEITTETLNEIENRVNGLIANWKEKNFAVLAPHGPRGGTSRRHPISGIKLWFDLHSGILRFKFRY